MPWSAIHRHARISARKARPVADLIRGRRASEAADILKYTNKRASYYLRKVLQSAVANADEQEADLDRLVVTEARVDEGPSLKRMQPKDRGRAFIILKRTSHIRVVVDQVGA